MPGRLIPLVTNEIYHVYNRGLDSRPTFTNVKEYRRALLAMNFYKFNSPPMKLSLFLQLSNEQRQNILREFLIAGKPIVEFLSFCLMPNHFHFLLKQTDDNGVSRFMSNFQNSFTRYSNTRHERIGQLFLDQFKAVRIETDEQLLHVSRYIHLNPYSSFIVKALEDLQDYPWSSLPEYLEQKESGSCDTKMILSLAGGKQKYKDFVFSHADYQRELEKIKHLILEQ